MKEIIKPFKVEIKERFAISDHDSNKLAYMAEMILRKLFTVNVNVKELEDFPDIKKQGRYYEVSVSFPEIDKYYTLAIANKLNNEIEKYVEDKIKNYEVKVKISDKDGFY